MFENPQDAVKAILPMVTLLIVSAALLIVDGGVSSTQHQPSTAYGFGVMIGGGTSSLILLVSLHYCLARGWARIFRPNVEVKFREGFYNYVMAYSFKFIEQ